MTRLTFLGTGTSQGVPMIGCGCEVCRSGDNRDKRLRASAFVEYGGLKILVDAGPDFRYQMLRAGISHLDAILLTHNHKDHTGGLDDVRAFNYLEGLPAEIYCEEYVEESLRKEYSYAFSEKKYPGAPEWHIHHIDEKPFTVYPNDGAGDRLVWISGKGYVHTGNMTTHTEDTSAVHDTDGRMEAPDTELTGNGSGREDAISTGNRPGAVEVIPIRGMHYRLPVLGFRFGDIAYCTDMNFIPENEFGKLHGLEHFVINCVKRGHHISHFSLEEAVATAEKVGARHSWLTHLSHQLPRYDELCRELPEGILPAYDGLVIEG